MALLSSEKIEKIDSAGRHILERVGLRIRNQTALTRLKAAGANVDLADQRVRFDGEWLDEILGKAPSRFVLYSRDGSNDLNLGAGHVYFGNGGRVFRVLDMGTGGYRATLLRDVVHTACLVNALENIRFYIIACQAHDVPPPSYHLNDFFHAFNNTSKHVMGGCDTVEGVRQMWHLASFIAGGEDQLRTRPFVSVITNPISPLTLDSTTLEILEFCVAQGIPVTCAPAPIAGATAPATLAGTLAQMHAESLAGVAISQVFCPGARVMYGAVPTAMDLRTMDLTMGSVETAMMNTCAVQLAKVYGLPIYASAGVTDAKIPDIQSGFEKGVSSLLVGMAGADYVHLAAGILDSGNSISYEQFIIDNEILGMVHRVLDGINVDEDTLAVECMKKVGPGGNYVMEDHTVQQMFHEFFYPTLTVRMNFDLWEDRGKPTPLTSANELFQKCREDHQAVLDPEQVIEIKNRFPGIVSP
ncbi:MAG: trimethylamine methyltransferase family protein [Deltaproteobacteria bacterium]|nr:trimethylamine methyltransferase family protein [Deltaproteobacteria bacterium]MBW1795953.1 trimethylamine methyltransferase family protein [Deltaproteobacteria bacterium]